MRIAGIKIPPVTLSREMQEVVVWFLRIIIIISAVIQLHYRLRPH